MQLCGLVGLEGASGHHLQSCKPEVGQHSLMSLLHPVSSFGTAVAFFTFSTPCRPILRASPISDTKGLPTKAVGAERRAGGPVIITLWLRPSGSEPPTTGRILALRLGVNGGACPHLQPEGGDQAYGEV